MLESPVHRIYARHAHSNISAAQIKIPSDAPLSVHGSFFLLRPGRTHTAMALASTFLVTSRFGGRTSVLWDGDRLVPIQHSVAGEH